MTKINYRRLDRQPKKRNPIAKDLSDRELLPKIIGNKKKEIKKSRKNLNHLINIYNNGMDVTDEFE